MPATPIERTVADRGGNVYAGARVRIREIDRVTPATDVFATEEDALAGVNHITETVTDNNGYFKVWIGQRRTVVVFADDNGGTATRPAVGPSPAPEFEIIRDVYPQAKPEDDPDVPVLARGSEDMPYAPRIVFDDAQFRLSHSEQDRETIVSLVTDPSEPPPGESFPTPSISSFSPPSGLPGIDVTITGTNFSGTGSQGTPFTTERVTFGGVASSNFTVNSATQITARVPSGAPTGFITVVTPGGPAASSTQFTVEEADPVRMPPVANFTVSASSGEAPHPVNFTDTSTDPNDPPGTPLTWWWRLGDGTQSFVQNPSKTYTAPGTYTVILVVQNSYGLSSEKSAVITVKETAAELGVTISADKTSGDVPLPVNFSSSVSGGTAPYTYAWDLAEGSTSTAPNPSKTYNNSGTFTAKLTVTDSAGAQKSASLTITVSGFTNVVTLSGTQTFTSDYIVPDGTLLRFDPNNNTTVFLNNCNLIVSPGAKLEMKPANRNIFHIWEITNVNESGYVGGGVFHQVPDIPRSDKGFWILGQIEARGTPVKRWNRTGDDPTWLASDNLFRMPYQLGDRGDAADFATWTKGQTPPLITLESGKTIRPEVLNVSGNVVFRGTTSGRVHMMISGHKPPILEYVRFRHMGPRKGGEGVLGRYPCHIHHGGDSARGSIIRGCLVQDSGNHAFVAHMSNGVTHDDCAAFNVQETPFWWDEPDPSNDTIWQHCLGAKVFMDKVMQRDAIFRYGLGTGNVARDCVGVGLRSGGGAGQAGAHSWVSQGHVWVTEDLVAHNCGDWAMGIWQNHRQEHRVIRSISYRNKGAIRHGAYRNPYLFDDFISFEDGEPGGLGTGVEHHANTTSGDTTGQRQIWKNMRFRFGAVNEEFGMNVVISHLPPFEGANPHIRWEDCIWEGWTQFFMQWNDYGQIGISNPGHAKCFDFIRCTVRKAGETGLREIRPSDFKIDRFADKDVGHDGVKLPEVRIRVRRANGTAFGFKRKADGTAELVDPITPPPA